MTKQFTDFLFAMINEKLTTIYDVEDITGHIDDIETYVIQLKGIFEEISK